MSTSHSSGSGSTGSGSTGSGHDASGRPDVARARTRREFLLWGGIAIGTPVALLACENIRSGPTGAPAGGPSGGRPDRPDSRPASATVAADGPRMPDLTPPTVEPTIRVRIQRRGPQDQVRIAAGPGARWLRVARPDGPVLLVLAAPVTIGAMVTTGSSGGAWTLVDGAGVRHTIDGSEPVEVGALRGESPAVTVDGTAYPGAARVVRRDDGGIDTINVCPLESYLPGVLARELYADWRHDTYRAQAVAARSFACTEMAFWRDRRHFDVVAGQASQAYIGQTAHASSNRAVAETRGAVLLWEGKVVPGYYSSSCGGHAASAVDAISDHPVNAIPPLAARPPMECCRWAPTWRWSAARTPSDAAQRIAAWARSRSDSSIPALQELGRIEVIAVNAHGRPVRYRVTDRRGAGAEFRAEHLRHALNHSDGSLAAPKDPIRSGHFDATPTSATIRLDGRGFGHGAGLCQYGAEGMARQSVRWTEILGTYYRGARIHAAYA